MVKHHSKICIQQLRWMPRGSIRNGEFYGLSWSWDSMVTWIKTWLIEKSHSRISIGFEDWKALLSTVIVWFLFKIFSMKSLFQPKTCSCFLTRGHLWIPATQQKSYFIYFCLCLSVLNSVPPCFLYLLDPKVPSKPSGTFTRSARSHFQGKFLLVSSTSGDSGINSLVHNKSPSFSREKKTVTLPWSFRQKIILLQGGKPCSSPKRY